ncbi:MAG: hypothetical protein ACLGGX_12620 [Bdellovibrionia bacterium]
MQIKKIQNQESRLATIQVLIVLMAPVFVSIALENEFSNVIVTLLVGTILTSLIWLQSSRHRLSKSIQNYYENLDSGVVLTKKITNSKATDFVITQATPHYYHLRSKQGEKQILVSRKRTHEDYIVQDSSLL